MKTERLRRLLFVAVAAAAAITPCAAGRAAGDGSAEVTIDLATRFQTIDGFGFSQRVFDDPHLTDTFDPSTRRGAVVVPWDEQEKILGMLLGDLGLSRVRPILGGGIESTNDNRDPEDTDLSKFDFTWKRNDALIDLVERMKQLGLSTYFPTPISFESWMSEENPEEYVEWAFAIIARWRERGVDLPYFSIVNEPGYGFGGIWSGEYIRDVIRMLGPKLCQAGIDTMFVVPDDLNPGEAARRLEVILADAEARRYVGAIAFHLYGGGLVDTTNLRELQRLGERYDIPLWMTEYSVEEGFEWANLIHTLLAEEGVSAVDHMWGFFGTWDFRRYGSTTAYIGIEAAGHRYVGSRPTKQYHYTGQYARFVRPGAVRVATDGAPAGVRLSAFLHPTEGTLTVVAINTNSSAAMVTLRLEGGSVSAFETVVRTSETEDGAALQALGGSAGRFETVLAPRSVTTFQGSVASIHERLLAEDYRQRLERGDVRLLQTLLAELGYDPGPIDGIIGPRTRAAAEAFASQAGVMDAIGPFDARLLSALGAAAAEGAPSSRP